MHANNKIMTNSLLENGRNEPGFVAAKSLGAAEHVKDRSSPATRSASKRLTHPSPSAHSTRHQGESDAAGMAEDTMR